MSDYFFNGGIDSDDEGCLIENGFKIARGIYKYKASAISHTVSNHDNLVEEVERLRNERDELLFSVREFKTTFENLGMIKAATICEKLLAKIKNE